MKMKNFLLIPASIIFMNVANAQENLPQKHVTVPFSDVALFSADHNGITFAYDMQGTPVKKIICRLNNNYKTWLEFLDMDSPRESGTYGGNQTVILTSKGKTHEENDSTDVFHADPYGIVNINGLQFGGEGQNATASCYYDADESTK